MDFVVLIENKLWKKPVQRQNLNGSVYRCMETFNTQFFGIFCSSELFDSHENSIPSYLDKIINEVRKSKVEIINT